MSVTPEDARPQVVMCAYASEALTFGEDEWPAAWVIVEVQPGGWRATLPVDQLLDLLTRPTTDVPLNEIPYWWDCDELSLSLGPALVSADAAGWRALVRRLLDQAGATRELNEVPRARPWAGPVTDLGTRDVTVPGGDPIWELRGTPGETVQELAAAGGFDALEFVSLFGAGWQRHDSGARDCEACPDRIYTWGEPAQLAALVTPEGLEVGVPDATWSGVDGPPRIGDPLPVHGWMTTATIRPLVEGIRRRRRRSLSWCRFCGRHLAPEERWSLNTCYACATTWHGVIY
jgi:hypothetical protein